MGKAYCWQHKDRALTPVMIHFGECSLGKQYICAVCSGIRVFNSGMIISLNPEKGFGFIGGVKDNIFFHFSKVAYDFHFHKGMSVFYEVDFLEDGRIQAVNIKPLNRGENGD